jgi:hypothetical protein
MRELFPEKEHELQPLADDHPIWQSRHSLSSRAYILSGMRHGGRTAVVYSPKDLSCYWGHAEQGSTNAAVINAIHLGQNVIDTLTNRKLPLDKLSFP